jgi:hypothetical protein
MNGGVLFVVVEAAIGVSHDGRQDPKVNGKPGYMSEDAVFECLTGHGKETSLSKAQNDHVTIEEHQYNRMLLLGEADRLEGDALHVGCCRFESCSDLEK